VLVLLRDFAVRREALGPRRATVVALVLLGAGVLGGALVAASGDLLAYMTVKRFSLDANHFWVGLGVVIVGIVAALAEGSLLARRVLWLLLVMTAGCGLLMLAGTKLGALARFGYTGFDAGLVLLAAVIAVALLRRLVQTPPQEG
jgi:hypothetical protein